MMYPLVQELGAEGIPVTATCGVLASTPRPSTSGRPTRSAIGTSTTPEFGYRLIADELEAAGHEISEGRVHRLCRQHKIWSTTTKKGRRSSGKTPGPAVHDDLVNRDFSAPAPNVTWLTDITEHPMAEGKLYACCIKDCFSNRIVGYALSDRMTAAHAVSPCAQPSPDANLEER